MNGSEAVKDIYTERVRDFSKALQIIQQKRNRIAWLRFAVVAATIAAIYFLWHTEIWIIAVTLVSGICSFLYVVSLDANSKETLLNTQRLIAINKEEIEILNNNYVHREAGFQYKPAHHYYADDLDLFGENSLYQYINRCNAEQSKQLLANNFLQALSTNEILLRQQAVKELTHKVDWQQQFQSYGIATPVTISTEKRIQYWLLQPKLFTEAYWQWLANIFPIISLGSVALCLFDVISAAALSVIILAFYFLSLSISKKITETYELLSRIVPQMQTMHKQLQHLEAENFTNEKMNVLKKHLQDTANKTASQQIKELKEILNRFDARLGFIFYILNSFLLWDLRQLLALNKWRAANDAHVTAWFDAIAQTEVAVSLATFAYNHPQYCYPVLAEEHFIFHGENIGHPLIAEKAIVTNSFQLQGVAKIGLITGSNMGGKSTFLRSIGVNTVLALMGSPVFASVFTVSPIQLISSMRIADNLAENTSTFYAELKKLQTIIEAVNRKEKIFILLDEILRGTNSLDRHTGSKALIKQLIQQHAVAVIATHDIELAKLEKDFPEAITNYHFDVQVANEELYFDYKIKPGICKSLNASLLMKKIGIEI